VVKAKGSEQLALGDHVCWMFDEEEQHLDAMAAIVAAGIAARHKILYFTESLLPAALLAGMEARRVPANRAKESGQLRICPARDSYLTGGSFEPYRIIDALDEQITEASSQGYQGTRIVGDMAWALGDSPGVEHLAWYEALFNRLFLDGRALAICQYNRRAFDNGVLQRVASAHPATRTADANGHWVALLRIQRTADPYGLRLIGEADATNRHALAASIEAVFASLPSPSTPIAVDVSELRFADAAAAGLLVRAAQAAAGGLRVTGCRPSLALVLETLAADNVPGLHVVPAEPAG
jgi:anti-anti-sigma regulatory factor